MVSKNTNKALDSLRENGHLGFASGYIPNKETGKLVLFRINAQGQLELPVVTPVQNHALAARFLGHLLAQQYEHIPEHGIVTGIGRKAFEFSVWNELPSLGILIELEYRIETRISSLQAQGMGKHAWITPAEMRASYENEGRLVQGDLKATFDPLHLEAALHMASM